LVLQGQLASQFKKKFQGGGERGNKNSFCSKNGCRKHAKQRIKGKTHIRIAADRIGKAQLNIGELGREKNLTKSWNTEESGKSGGAGGRECTCQTGMKTKVSEIWTTEYKEDRTEKKGDPKASMTISTRKQATKQSTA